MEATFERTVEWVEGLLDELLAQMSHALQRRRATAARDEADREAAPAMAADPPRLPTLPAVIKPSPIVSELLAFIHLSVTLSVSSAHCLLLPP